MHMAEWAWPLKLLASEHISGTAPTCQSVFCDPVRRYPMNVSAVTQLCSILSCCSTAVANTSPCEACWSQRTSKKLCLYVGGSPNSMPGHVKPHISCGGHLQLGLGEPRRRQTSYAGCHGTPSVLTCGYAACRQAAAGSEAPANRPSWRGGGLQHYYVEHCLNASEVL